MHIINPYSLTILKNHAQIYPEYIIVAYNDGNIGEFLRWKFPNNWGASVVATSNTQYRPELAIVRYGGDKDIHGTIDYSTNIATNVIHQITVTELATTLAKIQGLS